MTALFATLFTITISFSPLVKTRTMFFSSQVQEDSKPPQGKLRTTSDDDLNQL